MTLEEEKNYRLQRLLRYKDELESQLEEITRALSRLQSTNSDNLGAQVPTQL